VISFAVWMQIHKDSVGGMVPGFIISQPLILILSLILMDEELSEINLIDLKLLLL
jgi:hypothetical protein